MLSLGLRQFGLQLLELFILRGRFLDDLIELRFDLSYMSALLLDLLIGFKDLLLQRVVLFLDRAHLPFQVSILLLMHPALFLSDSDFLLQVLDFLVCLLLQLLQLLSKLILLSLHLLFQLVYGL